MRANAIAAWPIRSARRVLPDKRYALKEPFTDQRPWPLGFRLVGRVVRPWISWGDILFVLARRNRTDPRSVVRCHIVRLCGHVLIIRQTTEVRRAGWLVGFHQQHGTPPRCAVVRSTFFVFADSLWPAIPSHSARESISDCLSAPHNHPRRDAIANSKGTVTVVMC